MTVGELPVVWSLPPEETRAGWHALWWTFGPGGELAVMLVQERHLNPSTFVRGWVGAGVRPPFDAELVVMSAQGEPQRRIPLNGIPTWVSHLALLPESRFLLVSGRTRRDAEGTWEKNAQVYSPDGRPESALCLGDDIPALVTDHHGGIWTAYGDEGIYGGHPETSQGLAGWNTAGAVTWAPQRRLPDWPLQGSTAATEGEYVWLVWYSPKGTFLTRVTPATGEVTSYRSPLRDVDGFAVRGNRAVLTTRDHDRRSTELVRVELVDGTCVVSSRQKLPVPGRVVMHCGQGRDGTLLLRAGDTWIRIEA